VQGLRRYGFSEAADRIAMKFLSLVRDEYLKSGTIVEKYDVVHRSAEVSADIRFGYRSNETGFGWTNAVFTALLDELGSSSKHKLLNGEQAAGEGWPRDVDRNRLYYERSRLEVHLTRAR
jgi:hypothetical protein